MEGAKNIDFSFADMSLLSEVSSFIPNNIETLNFEGTDLRNLSSMRYWFQSRDNLRNVNFS
jgi:hypothetical protein